MAKNYEEIDDEENVDKEETGKEGEEKEYKKLDQAAAL